MLMSNQEFEKKYGKLFTELLKESQDYLANPVKLKNDILNKRKQFQASQMAFPEPDQFTYRSMRYQRFVEDPDCLKNYILSDNENYSEKVSFLPYIIDIEPNSRCNFRCIMCQVSDWDKGQRARDMTFEEYQDLIDSNPQLLEIKLQGMGEPLLHKDFIKMIEYACAKHIWVRTVINGSLLHIRKNIERLIDSGVGEIQTSFDGANKEVFESIRRKSNFERVVENFTNLNKYANLQNRPYTRMWVVLQRENRHQLFDFVEIAKKMEFRRLTFSLSIGDWGQDSWKDKKEELQTISFSNEEEENLIRLSKDSGIDISIWKISNKYSFDAPENLCAWPFTRTLVSSDMKVGPCCMIGNPDIANLGDGNDLIKTWNSKSYQDFRKSHLEGKIPKYCNNCYK